MKKKAKSFFISYGVCCLIFLSGAIFGFGYNNSLYEDKRPTIKTVVQVAYSYGFEKGKQAVVMDKLKYKPRDKNPGIGQPLCQLALAKL